MKHLSVTFANETNETLRSETNRCVIVHFKKQKTWVRHFSPYSDNKKLMDMVSSIYYLDGLMD